MKTFQIVFSKNIIKSIMVTIGAITSTIGLKSQILLFVNDNTFTIWAAVFWAISLICSFAYYKTKVDLELDNFREFEKNRKILGVPPTNQKQDEFKIGDPVFLQENVRF